MTAETMVVVSTADALDAAFSGIGCWLLQADGRSKPLAVDRWREAADDDDRRLFLDAAKDKTLDIGCGPGRLAAALTADGVPTLGIDISAEAVRQARDRGAEAIQGDIFTTIEDIGHWDRAILADGNIGIGGDPVRLLERVRELLHPGGTVVVEVARHGVGVVTEHLRLQVGQELTPQFHWSVVGADAIGQVADEAGFDLEEVIVSGTRQAAVLTSRPS